VQRGFKEALPIVGKGLGRSASLKILNFRRVQAHSQNTFIGGRSANAASRPGLAREGQIEWERRPSKLGEPRDKPVGQKKKPTGRDLVMLREKDDAHLRQHGRVPVGTWEDDARAPRHWRTWSWGGKLSHWRGRVGGRSRSVSRS